MEGRRLFLSSVGVRTAEIPAIRWTRWPNSVNVRRPTGLHSREEDYDFPSWKHTEHHLTAAEITAVPQRHLFRSSSSPVGTDWLQYIPSFKFACLLCPQCSTWNCSIITVIPCWLSIDQIQSLFLLMALGSVFHPSLGSRPLLTLPIEEV